MKRIKGCISDNCEEKEKRTKYQETDSYCKKCGNPLSFVCAQCFMPLPEEPAKRFCVRCEAERTDRAEERKRIAKKALGAIGATTAAIVPFILRGNKKT